MKKNGFTLAEVLITLGIIGVVAAITLPTLIQNHKKQVYVNGLKKAISTSQNMLKQMQADEEASSVGTTKLFTDGICNKWNDDGSDNHSCEDNYGNPTVFENIIPKYLKTVKICKNDTCPLYIAPTLLDNGKFSIPSYARKELPLRYPFTDVTQVLGFYATDGIIYYIAPYSSWNNTPGVLIGVDVNGNNPPNMSGRDYFQFILSGSGKLCEPPLDYCVYIRDIIDAGWKMNY